MNSLRSAGFKSWFSSDAVHAEGCTFQNSLAHSKWAREMKHLEVQLPKRRSLKSVTKQNSASNFRYSVLEKITMKNELWLEFWQHTRNTIYFHATSPIYSHCCKIWLQEHIYPLGILTQELQTWQFWQPRNYWQLPHQTDWKITLNWRTTKIPWCHFRPESLLYTLPAQAVLASADNRFITQNTHPISQTTTF